MRKPIRTKAKARGAARAIHYCLGLPCAWLLLLSVAACSSGDAESSPASNPADPPGASSSSAPLAVEADRQARRTTQALGQADQAATPVVVFLGTSLTAGYGLPEKERIDSSGLDYRVINAGVSGDTSAGGLRRLDWLLRLPIAALVLELGANDMLRGQSIGVLRANLEAILDRTSLAHPDVRFLIAGMRAAPNLGRDYVGEFDAIYPALAS